MDSTLQVRIDQKTKKEAQKMFKEMGIDTSSGVKMFLSHVVNTGSLPFTPITKNGFTKQEESEIITETKEALKKGKRFRNVAEAHTNILK